MTLVPVLCALAALPAGWFAGVLVDRVPDRKPLRPLPGVRLTGWYLFLYLAMIVSFTLVGLRMAHQPFLVIVAYLLFAAMLVTVSIIDIDCYRLPDRIVLPTLAASVVLVVVESLRAGHADRINYALAGAAGYFGILLLFHLIFPRGMGFGDVKLAAVMGLFLGWMGAGYSSVMSTVVWGMLVGFLLGAFIGFGFLVARRRSDPIPFGPWLAIGALTVVLLAPQLIPLPLNL